jgi:outer membrane protein, heavy metal efflux system
MRGTPTRAVPKHLRALCNLILLSLIAPLAQAGEPPLGLAEALAISEQRSSKLAAQSSAVSAAAEQVGRSSALPDPKLRLGIDNMPVSGPDAYNLTSDSQTMKRIGVMQEVPNSDKRKARSERAAREQALESVSLIAQRAQLRQDTAVSWLDLYYAQRTRDALGELVRQYELETDTVSAAVSAGRVSPAGAVALRSALESARDRVLEQQRVVLRAQASLAALVGGAAGRPLGGTPDTSALAHRPEALVSGLETHPALRVYKEREALAASEVALATSSAKPDWSVEVLYGQRTPNFSNMLTVMFSIDLPIDNATRQGRDIAARASLLERARSESEDARRMHEADVRTMISDWEITGQRVHRFETVLLPLARERTELALASYRGGRGELGAVLEARRAVVETQLGLFSAELERGRAWARLNHLVPQEVKP